MRVNQKRVEVWKIAGLAFIGLGMLGCTQAPDKLNPSPPPTKVSDEEDGHGWWCDEHGVPEEVCAQCNLKLTAEFKAKGDWCDEHDRPDSQCFVCHPEKQAEFADQYEAKYGKQPPKPEAEASDKHEEQEKI